MPYCDKCGSKNEEDAEFCKICGAALNEGNNRRRYRDDRYRQRNECFGLPHGGLIVGILIGILLILVGLSSIYGLNIWTYLWPIIIILIGILIILGAIYRYTHRD